MRSHAAICNAGHHSSAVPCSCYCHNETKYEPCVHGRPADENGNIACNACFDSSNAHQGLALSMGTYD